MAGALLVVAGCIDGPHLGDTLTVINGTGERVEVVFLNVDGKPDAPLELQPGAHGDWSWANLSDSDPRRLGRNGCTVQDVVVYSPEGGVIARQAPPLCAPGTWKIVAPTSTTTPS